MLNIAKIERPLKSFKIIWQMIFYFEEDENLVLRYPVVRSFVRQDGRLLR
jgi:hypothetical protein